MQVGLAEATANVDEATFWPKVGMDFHEIHHFLHGTAGELSIDGPTGSIATKTTSAPAN